MYCRVAVNLIHPPDKLVGVPMNIGTPWNSEIAHQNRQKNKATPIMTAKPLTSTTGAVRMSKPARSGRTLGWRQWSSQGDQEHQGRNEYESQQDLQQEVNLVSPGPRVGFRGELQCSIGNRP